MPIELINGSLLLVGSKVDAMGRAALQRLPHLGDAWPRNRAFSMQLLAPLDYSSADRSKASLYPDSIEDHIYPLGIGLDAEKGYHFLAIVCIAGNIFRRSLSLPSAYFHIPLDVEDRICILSANQWADFLLDGELALTLRSPPDALDHIALALHQCKRFALDIEVSTALCTAEPESARGFCRLGDAASKLESYKLAMLSYGAAWHRTGSMNVRDYCVKRIVACSGYTEWGCVLRDDEASQVLQSLCDTLFSPWSAELRGVLCQSAPVPELCLESRERMLVPRRTRHPMAIDDSLYRLPRFFRWLIPFHFALMSTPKTVQDVEALASPPIGIRHVLTLTEEEPLPATWFSGRISNTFLPIPNYHPPSIEQMDLIMRLFEDEEKLPLLVHCGGGKGRAGTVAACYLVAYGFARPDPHRTHPAMSANEAIAALRRIRPGSLETAQQEAFVAKWCSALWKRGAMRPPPVPEPMPCSPEIEGRLDVAQADLLLLVGLPGSGKSWFSSALLARNPTGWNRISQDDAGSRSTCETAIGRTPVSVDGKPSPRVLLDRCNTSSDDRRSWLSLAHWATRPVCVYFDYSVDLCTSRAQNRAGHPTLPPGGRVRSAVEQMQRVFVKPTLSEGWAAIVTIRSFEAANELARRFSPPVGLLKFPRTPHLLDLGAATEDDIVQGSNLSGTSSTTRPPGHRVVITEKIDGANMGFALSADKQIVVQNRSHHVNPASHAQFKRLGLWIEEHRDGLYRILDRDALFPERYILYGEWLAATHSIPYSRLPDYFVAFDLYDRTTGTWADRRALESLLEETGIWLVPVVHEGEMPEEDEMKRMVRRQSQFYDGMVEGVYVKVEAQGRVASRGKVVRADFIAGNEHWTRGQLQWNGIQPVQ